MSGHVKTYKDKKNKSMTLGVNNDKLLENYKTIVTKIKDLKKY